MEQRLIDANKLVRRLKAEKSYANPLDYDTRSIYEDCIGIVSAMEAVDAEPVQSGHWEWRETWLDESPEYPCELLEEGWACSACGVYLMQYLKSHFHDIESYAECISDEMPTIERCPHCGAKMMEKQND